MVYCHNFLQDFQPSSQLTGFASWYVCPGTIVTEHVRGVRGELIQRLALDLEPVTVSHHGAQAGVAQHPAAVHVGYHARR